jgi:hypothetical protein
MYTNSLWLKDNEEEVNAAIRNLETNLMVELYPQ